MPTLRNRAQTLQSPANPSHNILNGQAQTTETQKVSLYEQSREERIKENRERMQKLGIFDLSLKINSVISTRRTPKNRNTTPRSSPARSSGPIRRSSRLRNVTPVTYAEVPVMKKGKSLRDEDIVLEEGSKPELYTEEHEKLLGNTERSWTLFVDGVGKDGKRIYDPVSGKTCHQCRQKTLGYRTHCRDCNMVQGQFCGDCLYMRYGEHVLEAIQNPSWICPVCRGICNCSLCRQAKGWPPTGCLYRKISKLGYKSVAHYLIQTRRLQTDLDENADIANQVSVKRSLPFSDIEVQSEGSLEVDSIPLVSLKPQSEDKTQDELKIEKENEMPSSPNPGPNNQVLARRSLPFLVIESQAGNMQSLVVDHEGDDFDELSKPQSGEEIDEQFQGDKEKELIPVDKEHGISNNVMESHLNLKKRALPIDQSPDSISGRLRQRHRKGNGHNDDGLAGANEKISDVKLAIISSKSNAEQENEVHSEEIYKNGDDIIAPKRTPKLKKKPAPPVAEPSLDSIGGRLRSRRITT
ncbi:uncharacterized protein LOC122306418 [Carya illinoinensis]|uniref:Zinc-finger domain-containing protein n=1 Tax=Carya illinoinensis TaxID=32201 RepID=A0A8T1RHL8_CARIL|nr:uncharacterized protein LOC122306418 [Carya illinoinensis]KAG6666366.1 hypothetical protein CIPAW_01G026800 [Carya illinoinensis]